MFFVIIFIILSTVISYILLDKLQILKSKYLHISLSYFLGQYASLLIIFILSCITSEFASLALNKVSIIYIFSLALYTYFLIAKNKLFYLGSREILKKKYIISQNNFYVLFCLIFSFLLFIPHLIQIKNIIYTSPVYWDFNTHFPIIQNFVFGDNFPPQNESFAGIAMTFHYYFDFLTSIYSALGLGLVNAINFASISFFFIMLMGIIGLSEELFNSRLAGFLAVILTITSSSFHFINYFFTKNTSFFEKVLNIFSNTSHPYFFSIIDGDPFGYNGNMFNVFYFVAERHMIFGIIFLIFSFTFLFYKNKLSNILAFIFGTSIGLFVYGHIFIVIMTITAVTLLLILEKERKKTLFILCGISLTFVPIFFYLKNLMHSDFFNQDINNFPKINPNFPTMPGSYSFSIVHDLGYYFYGYGIKIFFIVVGFILFWKKNKKLFYMFLTLILPTFLFINTLQLEPLSVYDNHKWLRPMNILIDIITGYVLVILLSQKLKLIKVITGICFVLLTLSGFIELMPFLNSKPTSFYAYYPSKFINDIRNNSSPRSVFASYSSKELHLAGRKLYLGFSTDEPGTTSVIDSSDFNKQNRENVMKKIYSTQSLKDFCDITLKNDIDFVAVNDNDFKNKVSEFYNFPKFNSINEHGENVIFFNIIKGCKNL